MAGLLDFLTDKENPLPLLALMGAAGVAGSRSKGEAVHNGLTGLLQGIVAIDNKKDENAKYLAAQTRQQQQDALEARVKEAQIQHYLYQQQNGADPYFKDIPTPNGIVKFNVRTGEATLITDANGNPIIKSSDSPQLQGSISGAKKNAETANTMFEQEGADGSKSRFMGSQFPNYQQPQNNNIGNLRNPNGQGFQQFATPEEGQQALSRQIGLYSTRHGIDNLNDFTARYAPKGDGNNDPVAYAKFLAQQTGIDPNAHGIDFSNPEVNAAMTRAIPIMEQGWKKDPQGALNEVRQGNAFSAPIVQAGRDAVANGTMTKPQAMQMMNAAADGIKKDIAVDPFRSPTKAETLNQEVTAQGQKDQNKANIEVKTEQIKRQQEKVDALPDTMADFNNLEKTVNEIEQHPGLSKGVGMIGQFARGFPGFAPHDFAVKAQQFGDQSFLAQIPKMKGFGQLTEQEGARLVSSLSTLADPTQSEEQYRKEIGNVRQWIGLARERANTRAGVQQQPSNHIDSLLDKYK